MAEIATVFHMTYTSAINQSYLNAFMQNMYREDIIYVDPKFNFWSTSKEGEGKENYELFSEKFARMFPGYCLDEEMRVRAQPCTLTINLKQLTALLKSKDADLWEKNRFMFENEMRFLDG